MAIVHGNPEWDNIKECSNIGYVDNKSLGVCDHGKSTHSNFQVIARSENFSLINARIFTGRTHQIRIHLSHLGHPLVGEEWYCKPPCTLHKRQALHAWKISLDSNPLQNFIAPIPIDFKNLADKVNLQLPNL